MSIKEDVIDAKKELENLKTESFALEVIKFGNKDKKRLFVALVIVLFMWFATICAFLYYINTTGFEEERTQEVVDLEDLTNSYIINGDISGKDKAD